MHLILVYSYIYLFCIDIVFCVFFLVNLLRMNAVGVLCECECMRDCVGGCGRSDLYSGRKGRDGRGLLDYRFYNNCKG